MKDTFIPYKTVEGFNVYQNLVYSFISMYGKTYASNQYISEKLVISVKSVSRSIKFLVEEGYITINNPKGRSRFIQLSLSDPQPRLSDPQVGLTVSHKRDSQSHYNKDNNKVYNKAYNKDTSIEVDEIIFEPIKEKKDTTNEVELYNRLQQPNDCIAQLLDKKGI